MTYFWNDEVYAEFYAVSTAERGLVNKVKANLSDCWHPTSAELDKFQSSFAAWSAGSGALKERDFRSAVRAKLGQ
eukprot:g3670.t1